MGAARREIDDALARFVVQRTQREPPDNLALDAALVLMHVDGMRTVEALAAATGLSLGETIEVVFDLIDAGVAVFADNPKSTGRYRKTSI